MAKKTKTPVIDESVDMEAKHISMEREIRRYVKRKGGFRKEISPEDMEKGKKCLEDWNKTFGRDRKAGDGWDTSFVIPGYDNY